MNAVLEDVSINPFPGLRPFKIEESHLFFGREGQTDEVLLKLSQHRFCGIIGPSGSGKSSFVYCGVLPILYGGFLTEASSDWEVVVTRPGAGPIENLAQALLENDVDYIVADEEERKIKRTIITTLLRSSSLGLVEAVQQSRKRNDRNFLILVDQFEELFRFKDNRDNASVNETLAYINLLIEAVNYPDSPIYVALTMRSDFIGDCAQFPNLTKKINDSHYLIPQLTREQKKKAIEGPVAVGGADITPRLVQLLLNDLGDNPDQLPILQHALMRTWDYWLKYKDVDSEPLDIKHYEAIGTMREALSMHANEAFDELNDTQKHICELLFKAITEKRGENFGIRRPTRLAEIASIADVAEEDVIDIIDKFREPGRSLLTPAHTVDITGKSIIDISHESLMRIWVRLKNWVDDEAEAVQMYQRLAEAAAMYQVGKAGLWRPPDLHLALNWQTKHKPTLVWGQRYHPAFERTMVFLEYSRKEFETEERIKELQQKRRLRNARITALVLATATVISLGFLVFALFQRTQALKNEELANAKTIEAQENLDQAKINEQKAQQSADIAEKRRLEAEAAKLAAEEQKKQAEQARDEADQQRVKAENAEAQALIEKNNAIAAQKEADLRRLQAEEAERRASALRHLSIAKALAIKSKEIADPNLKGLMAQQAYNFNKDYAGYELDNDIYQGLYFALSSFNDPLTISLSGHEKEVSALVTSKDSKYVYSAGSDGTVIRWHFDGLNRRAEKIADRGAANIIKTLALSKDNSLLAIGGSFPSVNNASFIELINLNKLSETPIKVEGITGAVWKLEYGANGDLYILDNQGRSIRKNAGGKAVEIIKSDIRINDMAASPDGKYIIGAGADGGVYRWSLANGSMEKIDNNKNELSSIAYSQDGKLIVHGNSRGLVSVIDVSSGKKTELSGQTGIINEIIFSFDNGLMATGSSDKTVRIYNLKELVQKQPIVLNDHPNKVEALAFTPDGSQIIAGTFDKLIKAWPIQIEVMAERMCGFLESNFTKEQWEIYVAPDIEMVETCENIK